MERPARGEDRPRTGGSRMPLPKLLIVEDDEDTSRQLTWGLKEDFDLVTAGDRYQALRRARIDHPDVILLDLGLPPSPADPEEGLRLMQDLRKGGTGKIIVYTGCGQWEHAVRATSYGAFDVLTKPVDLEALRFLLHRVCWISELEQQRAGVPAELHGESEEMIGTSQA